MISMGSYERVAKSGGRGHLRAGPVPFHAPGHPAGKVG